MSWNKEHGVCVQYALPITIVIWGVWCRGRIKKRGNIHLRGQKNVGFISN